MCVRVFGGGGFDFCIKKHKWFCFKRSHTFKNKLFVFSHLNGVCSPKMKIVLILAFYKKVFSFIYFI